LRSTAPLAADRTRALELTPVSRETAARLDRFVELLLKWQATTNLIGPSTIPNLWTRHIADSLQLLPLAPGARVWIDIGSGAGFPGLPIACALVELAGTEVHLIESNLRKAAFLRDAVAATGAPAIVHAVRMQKFVESFPGHAEVVAARAVSSLNELMRESLPLLEQGALGLYPKGQDVEAELTAASKCWNMVTDLVPSRTDPAGRIVVVRALERRRRVP
jgi:16S rRNA (guanine527-N7)-methyltransferase